MIKVIKGYDVLKSEEVTADDKMAEGASWTALLMP